MSVRMICKSVCCGKYGVRVKTLNDSIQNAIHRYNVLLKQSKIK